MRRVFKGLAVRAISTISKAAVAVGVSLSLAFGASAFSQSGASGAGLFNGTIIARAASHTVMSRTLTAQEIVRDMGLGWNLGNSLDSVADGNSDQSATTEGAWGNPIVTQALIDAVYAKGFKTIRIPTTWFQHIAVSYDSTGKKVYTINRQWLARVKEVVDYAYNNDMYIILNVHHESWINRSDFISEAAYSEMSEELKQVWKQIAEYFKDYDQHLIFEGMNEPRAAGSDEEWYIGDASVRSSALDIISRLNNDFVTTVRGVASNYQYTRMLMVPGYAASCDPMLYEDMVLPGGNDSNNNGVDDYVAVSIHAYRPYEFAMGDGDHSKFTEAYRASLSADFANMRRIYTSKGIPVVIGEFSASNYGYDDARIAWAESYMTIAKGSGIPCVLWDNNVNTIGDSEVHGYVNRWNNNTWFDSGEKVVNQLLATYNDAKIAWGGLNVVIVHDSFSNGSAVNVSDGFIFKDGIGGFGEGKEIAIKYNYTRPTIAPMNSDWGGWIEISPDDVDAGNKIAYFSYEHIMNMWAGGSAPGTSLCHIKIATGDGASNIAGVAILSNRTVSSGSTDPSGGSTDPSGGNNDPIVETPVKVQTISLTAGGYVGINFYMTLPEKASRIVISGAAGEVTAEVSALEVTSDGYYKAEYMQAAKNMADPVTVTVYDSSNNRLDFVNESRVSGGLYVCSVNDAIELGKAAAQGNQVLNDLYDSMAVYGNNARAYFGMGASYINNSYVNQSVLNTYAPEEYGTLPNGIAYVGSALVLEHGVSTRHYFSGDLSRQYVALNYSSAKAVKVAGADELYYIESNINSYKDLAAKDRLTVGGWELRFGAATYCYNALENPQGDIAKLCAAIYAYMSAAEKYFN